MRDFFKIQLVVNPLRNKITFSFDEVQCFYFFKEFRTNIVRFFFFFFRSFERSELQPHGKLGVMREAHMGRLRLHHKYVDAGVRMPRTFLLSSLLRSRIEYFYSTAYRTNN